MPFDPKNLKYDQHGVPYLKSTDIEGIAYEVLGKYCPAALKTPRMTPIGDILQGLFTNTGLLLARQDLGYKDTAKILGKVNFPKKTLFLDVSLDGERKAAFRFTAAHEIGHWVLHRHRWIKLRLSPRANPMDEFTDDEKSMYRLDQRTPKEWLEFQANVFAASLIMPREPFGRAVVKAQLEMDIVRNLGVVFLTADVHGTRTFQELVMKLSHVYDVSRESVKVRLRTLKMLHDETAREVKSAKQVFQGGLLRN